LLVGGTARGACSHPDVPKRLKLLVLFADSAPGLGSGSPILIRSKADKLFAMQVRVLFFGMLKDVAGRSSDVLSVPEGSTVGDVLRHYESEAPRLREFRQALAISLNREYAQPESCLHDQDEIGLLPPVSGGSNQGEPTVAIVRENIRSAEVMRAIQQPEDGALAVFEGVVRNHSRDRRTLYLDYEAYEPMALAKMQELAGEAGRKFSIRQVALVHRLGRLEIGETSVLVAVASAHRAAAFDACRWLIDTLKRTVPIWKKEYFEDGAVWADGEPFPQEIRPSDAEANQGS
jgi:MoaE-MoaD fusion protein